jgi:hypothetical protein
MHFVSSARTLYLTLKLCLPRDSLSLLMGRPHKPQPAASIRTINLEAGMPRVHEALAQLERELATARRQHCAMLKLIHGYGSSGVGGDIRIAVQKRLRKLQDQGTIRAFILGEDWSASDAQTWALLKVHPSLKMDPHLGKRNAGITIVVL